MSVTIRLGVPADAATLAELAARTFRDAFAADNRPEDIEQHVAQAYGSPQQGRELADANLVTLLAQQGEELAGYAQLRLGPAPACVDANAPIELSRFYVVRRWHGEGVAQSLMRRVDEEAGRIGARMLWLGVWERNERAKAFYRKSGFVDVGARVFMVGTDAQNDLIMARTVA
jgi:GNAT superfamily N-acetyltransferase